MQYLNENYKGKYFKAKWLENNMSPWLFLCQRKRIKDIEAH